MYRAIALLLAVFTTAWSASTDSSFYVFGDSLADTGRFKGITRNIIPPKPYWNGRFSCGPVWSEYTSLLQHSTLNSFAVAGATAATTDTKPFGVFPMSIPSTRDQIASFANTSDIIHSTAVLEIGANDLMNAIKDIKNGKLSSDSFADSLSSSVVSQLETLEKIGFKTILVANMPALDRAPLLAIQKRTDIAREIVNVYNQQLSAKIATWTKTSSADCFAVLDINAFMQAVFTPAVSKSLGITDTTNSCVGGKLINLITGTTKLSSLLDTISDNKDSTAICTDPGSHFFWDPLHPTDRVHRLFGYYVNSVINGCKAGNSVSVTKDLLVQLIKKHRLNTTPPQPAQVFTIVPRQNFGFAQ